MEDPAGNPAGWPDEVLPMLRRALTCEFATVTRRGTPVTLPLTPYLGEGGRTLDVSTGLTYPAKAERARRDPRVGILFSDPVGSGLAGPPVVLVYGVAAVRDRDLQANTDRYLRLSFAKIPALYRQVPWFLLRHQRWYWSRIWILTTPVRILWWPGGRVDEEPRRWQAPADVATLESDAAPPGRQPPAWRPGGDWRPRAARALRHLGLPVLTVMDAEGFPVPVRVRAARPTAGGFALQLPGFLPAPARGAACLTFHEHDARFAREENATFVGTLAGETAPGGEARFAVERALGDLSAPGAYPRRVWGALTAGARLGPRTRAEAARRGQPVPRVRRP